jgi:hypothetical protein
MGERVGGVNPRLAPWAKGRRPPSRAQLINELRRQDSRTSLPCWKWGAVGVPVFHVHNPAIAAQMINPRKPK